jgi:hypothetical protein
MSFEPFYERFQRLASIETRSLTILDPNDFNLPADKYSLLELYCNDKNCDCQRVMFDVISEKRNELVAVVAYGWESQEYYYKWFGGLDRSLASLAVKEMHGISLNLSSQQSTLAPAILEAVRWVLKDQAYVDRLKRHYQIFKENVEAKYFREPIALKPAAGSLSRHRKRHHPHSNDD